MSRHANRLGIFVAHAYVNDNDRRYHHTDAGEKLPPGYKRFLLQGPRSLSRP